MQREELQAWMRLTATPGFGRRAARQALGALGSAPALWDAPAAAWHSLGQPRPGDPEADFEALVERTWQWLQAEPAAGVLTLQDADYPRALLQTPDPPLLLYTRGDVRHLQQPMVAVVGSRNPTAQGDDNALAFGRALAQAGWTVVSGLALGVDAAAHRGALQGAGGTVAVTGTGLDRVYPARNRELAHKIVEHGVIVSEFPLGTPPLPGNFPSRNRIIAGLGQGTLVVEAALQSGSLITARLAGEMGREVFAIPGSIHAPQSRGCHALLRQGAKLVETAQDVLEELQGGPAAGRPARPDAAAPGAGDPAAGTTGGAQPGPARALLVALGDDPAGLDALCARTGIDPGQASAHLLELEFAGAVARLPGGLYQRRRPA